MRLPAHRLLAGQLHALGGPLHLVFGNEAFLLQVDSQYGNCYTFVPWNNLTSTFIGPTFGLQMVLYADEPSNYIDSVTSDVGFQVQVHPAEYQVISHCMPSRFLLHRKQMSAVMATCLESSFIKIHPQAQAFPGDLGFTLTTGERVAATVKMTRIKRLPLPYDNTDCGLVDAAKGAPVDVFNGCAVQLPAGLRYMRQPLAAA